MKDHLEMLSRKGTVTVVEHGGKAIVAVQHPNGGIVTLEGGTKAQLLAELCRMVAKWPDVS
jgi:hypothetical protein